MFSRKSSGPNGMFNRDRKLDEAFLLNSSLKVLDKVGYAKFTGMVFDRDFPRAGRGYKDGRLPIRDDSASFWRQLVPSFEPPNQGVRIQ